MEAVRCPNCGYGPCVQLDEEKWSCPACDNIFNVHSLSKEFRATDEHITQVHQDLKASINRISDIGTGIGKLENLANLGKTLDRNYLDEAATLEKAEGHLLNGDYEIAIDFYDELVKEYPRRYGGWYGKYKAITGNFTQVERYAIYLCGGEPTDFDRENFDAGVTFLGNDYIKMALSCENADRDKIVKEVSAFLAKCAEYGKKEAEAVFEEYKDERMNKYRLEKRDDYIREGYIGKKLSDMIRYIGSTEDNLSILQACSFIDNYNHILNAIKENPSQYMEEYITDPMEAMTFYVPTIVENADGSSSIDYNDHIKDSSFIADLFAGNIERFQYLAGISEEVMEQGRQNAPELEAKLEAQEKKNEAKRARIGCAIAYVSPIGFIIGFLLNLSVDDSILQKSKFHLKQAFVLNCLVWILSKIAKNSKDIVVIPVLLIFVLEICAIVAAIGAARQKEIRLPLIGKIPDLFKTIKAKTAAAAETEDNFDMIDLTNEEGGRYCPSCGAPLDDDSVFCASCGAKLD